MRPKRHVWEEGSTHRAVAGKEYDEVWDYADELEAELKEHDDYYRKVVDDQCAPDEVHCTCVPALRAKIKELEEYKEAFLMSLEVALKKALKGELNDH